MGKNPDVYRPLEALTIALIEHAERSFLTLMSSGFVGVSLVDVPWIPGPVIETITPAPTDCEGLVIDVTRAMARALPDLRGRFVPDDYRLGTDFDQQWQVSVALGPDGAIHARQQLLRAAIVLAQRIHEQGLRCFGALPIPRGVESGCVATDERTGITVRGLRAWWLGDDEHEPGWMTTFDVLGRRA